MSAALLFFLTVLNVKPVYTLFLLYLIKDLII